MANISPTNSDSHLSPSMQELESLAVNLIESGNDQHISNLFYEIFRSNAISSKVLCFNSDSTTTIPEKIYPITKPLVTFLPPLFGFPSSPSEPPLPLSDDPLLKNPAFLKRLFEICTNCSIQDYQQSPVIASSPLAPIDELTDDELKQGLIMLKYERLITSFKKDEFPIDYQAWSQEESDVLLNLSKRDSARKQFFERLISYDKIANPQSSQTSNSPVNESPIFPLSVNDLLDCAIRDRKVNLVRFLLEIGAKVTTFKMSSSSSTMSISDFLYEHRRKTTKLQICEKLHLCVLNYKNQGNMHDLNLYNHIINDLLDTNIKEEDLFDNTNFLRYIHGYTEIRGYHVKAIKKIIEGLKKDPNYCQKSQEVTNLQGSDPKIFVQIRTRLLFQILVESTLNNDTHFDQILEKFLEELETSWLLLQIFKDGQTQLDANESLEMTKYIFIQLLLLRENKTYSFITGWQGTKVKMGHIVSVVFKKLREAKIEIRIDNLGKGAKKNLHFFSILKNETQYQSRILTTIDLNKEEHCKALKDYIKLLLTNSITYIHQNFKSRKTETQNVIYGKKGLISKFTDNISKNNGYPFFSTQKASNCVFISSTINTIINYSFSAIDSLKKELTCIFMRMNNVLVPSTSTPHSSSSTSSQPITFAKYHNEELLKHYQTFNSDICHFMNPITEGHDGMVVKDETGQRWCPMVTYRSRYSRFCGPFIESIKSIFQERNTSCRIRVEAPAGVGKTSLSRYLAQDFQKCNMFDMVFHLELRNFSNKDRYPEDRPYQIIDLIERELFNREHWDYHFSPHEKILLEDLIENGRILWILDGFDELVESSHLKALVDEILKTNWFIVTSRPDWYSSFAFDDNLRLGSYSNGDIQQFTVNFIDRAYANHFPILSQETLPLTQDRTDLINERENIKNELIDLITSPRLKRICTIPLTLKYACEMYLSKYKDKLKNGDFIDIPIYYLEFLSQKALQLRSQAIIDSISQPKNSLVRVSKVPNLSKPLKKAQRFIKHLAFLSLCEERLTIAPNSMINQAREAQGISSESQAKINELEEMVKAIGVTIPTSEGYEFAHAMLQEHLAAKYLTKIIKSRTRYNLHKYGKTFVEKHLGNRNYDNVFFGTVNLLLKDLKKDLKRAAIHQTHYIDSEPLKRFLSWLTPNSTHDQNVPAYNIYEQLISMIKKIHSQLEINYLDNYRNLFSEINRILDQMIFETFPKMATDCLKQRTLNDTVVNSLSNLTDILTLRSQSLQLKHQPEKWLYSLRTTLERFWDCFDDLFEDPIHEKVAFYVFSNFLECAQLMFRIDPEINNFDNPNSFKKLHSLLKRLPSSPYQFMLLYPQFLKSRDETEVNEGHEAFQAAFCFFNVEDNETREFIQTIANQYLPEMFDQPQILFFRVRILCQETDNKDPNNPQLNRIITTTSLTRICQHFQNLKDKNEVVGDIIDYCETTKSRINNEVMQQTLQMPIQEDQNSNTSHASSSGSR